MKILIDNGHGIDTKGKRSPDGQLLEYAQNRLLAGRIVFALQARGLDASLLVPEETDISLPERCRRVNEWCRQLGKDYVLLISIHCNAAGRGDRWLSARGWCAYTTRGNPRADALATALYTAARAHLPGHRRHLGLLRNYLAEGDCAAGVVSVVIPGYAGVWGFDLDQFQVYARFILLDSITGYRSQYHEYATLIRATEGTAIGPASQED